MVYYEYDAWGNNIALNATGSLVTSGIGVLNPFRYRGYYYDTDTKLYYLQSRYYDPEIGRFISQDAIEYADPTTINGLNLYAYCGNNPVMNVDPNGTAWWHIVLGIALVAAVTLAMVVTAGIAAAAIGVAGTAIATGMMVGAGVATATAGAINLFTQFSNGVDEFNIGSLMFDMIFSGTVGMITGGFGGWLSGFSIGASASTNLIVHKTVQGMFNMGISAVAYLFGNSLRGEDITLAGLAIAAGSGFVSGFTFDYSPVRSMILAIGLEIASYSENLIDIIKRVFNRN